VPRGDLIMRELRENSVEFVCWLPDSETHFMHGPMTADDTVRVISVCAEGEALAIAAGICVAGSSATVLIEDQGLFDSGNVLKWIKTLEVPVVLMVGYLFYSKQGSHGYLEPFLNAFGVPYYIVDSDESVGNVSAAYARARETNGVVAVLLSSADGYHPGSAPSVLGGYPTGQRAKSPVHSPNPWTVPTLGRRRALEIVSELPDGAVVITTMSASIDWADVAPSGCPSFNVAGAMGYASSFSLGIALAQPTRPVVVIDGDGSLLMNLGSLVTTVETQVRNLVWLVLENGVYELTGGNTTPALGHVDLAGFARAAGWENVHALADEETLAAAWPEILGTGESSFGVVRVVMAPPQPLDLVGLGNPLGIAGFRVGLARSALT
jgi:sulfopyruvate decarboxylase TPP-binding subunit